MENFIRINKKINSFSKKINVEGDKSLSIRWVISLFIKKINCLNLLKSEDVLSALDCVKILGSKVKIYKNKCEITESGLNFKNLKNKKKLIFNAGNSGTLGRIILGLLINSKRKIKLIGDKSLSKRDFSRVTLPLKKFGAKFNKYKRLPIEMEGLESPKK